MPLLIILGIGRHPYNIHWEYVYAFTGKVLGVVFVYIPTACVCACDGCWVTIYVYYNIWDSFFWYILYSNLWRSRISKTKDRFSST